MALDQGLVDQPPLVRLFLLVAKGREIADEIIFHAVPFVWVSLPLLNDFLL